MAESDSAICSASGSGGGAGASASTLAAASATRSGAANREDAFDANGLPWDLLLPWLLFDARATALGPHESLEPLTPRASPEFGLALLTTRHLSWELPFFLNTNTTATAASISIVTSDQDGLPQQAPCTPRASHDTSNAANAHDRHPSHTSFFLSPSASTSSLFSSAGSWASDPSRTSDSHNDSADTLSTMPGPLLELPPLTPFDTSVRDEYPLRRPSTCAAPEMAIDSTPPWRPQSTRSGTSGSHRPSSPLFARWAKRHHHQGHRHHVQDGPLQSAGTGTGTGTGPVSRSGRGSTESKASHSSSMSPIVKRSPARSRPSSMHKRQSHLGSVPQMTRDEFEALPLAIQRKYFSTLERLRFARESTHVEGISQHYNDISHYKRRKPRQNRSVSEQIASRITRRSSLLESRFTTPDSSASCVGLPDRVYSREEQVALARHLRASVILDAADEAICKLNRRASKKHIIDAERTPPAVALRRDSMESLRGPASPVADRPSAKDVPQSFYETFRWMDEEEDLDLRLFLDDYHANLRDDLPTPTNQQRPSFRRHLSISKIPFSRNSVSLSRPATKDATTPASPLHSPPGSASQPAGYTKRKSRALSLITPRHAPQSSISSIDPAAAHYQDPEARLKLRVYLASPQKFDEAIEFGFPSADVLSGGPVVGKGGGAFHQRQPSSNMRSFLADDDDDDNISLNSDQPSLADPDSPKTPQATEPKYGPVRPLRAPSTEPASFPRDGRRTPEPGTYAQAPASSREMTLRMTLTRPDLRAHEEQIYGWQQPQQQQQQAMGAGRKSTTLAPMMAMESVTYIGDGKESLERVGPANYDWSSTTADKGVMKRIWNRVRRA